MKRTLILLFVAFAFQLNAQADKATIKAKANEVAEATVNSDWETVAKYTYPKIIQLMGGKEKMKEIMLGMMQQQQITFESAEIGDPSEIYKTGENDLFSLVPQTIVMKMPGYTVTNESYLIAISENKGERWYFLDTAQITMENVQNMIPNYNMDLVIPAKKEPIVVAD